VVMPPALRELSAATQHRQRLGKLKIQRRRAVLPAALLLSRTASDGSLPCAATRGFRHIMAG
jgi:hypothetical protein